MDIDDTEVSRLTAGVSSGHRESIEEFYDQYFDFMYSEAHRCSGRDESFCLDIVQEATLKAVRRMHTMTSERHFRSWVRVVVRSVAYDLFRQEMRRHHREKRRPLQTDSSTLESADLDRTARLVWLDEQLRVLDPASANLLRMRYRLGWTLAKIGQVLGVKAGAVDSRVRRLIQTLQREAETDFDDQ